jgi:hypothetical protein
MATRSFIGIENEDGSIDAVYCHWDGYPPSVRRNGVGEILSTHYTKRAKIRRLIRGGGLSILGATITPAKGQAHTFEAPADGVCLYYHRDRREPLDRCSCESLASFAAMARASWACYAYVFTADGRWLWAGVAAYDPGAAGWNEIEIPATV